LSGNHLTYHDSKLYYQKHIGGEKTLLIFHGFGHTHQNMEVISQYFLKKGYTVYSFDLFFHGNSTRTEATKPISIQELKQIIDLFLQKENISTFELLSYSLGSRFALTILGLYPKQVAAIYLIAPDAIQLSKWYRFSTSTWLGNKLFALVTQYPIFYQLLLSCAEKLKLANPSAIRFARNQMKTLAEREKIYHTWMSFRKLYQPFDQLSEQINQHQIQFKLFLGKYDRMIPHKILIQKCQSIHQKHIYVYDTGHNQLIHLDQLIYDLLKE